MMKKVYNILEAIFIILCLSTTCLNTFTICVYMSLLLVFIIYNGIRNKQVDSKFYYLLNSAFCILLFVMYLIMHYMLANPFAIQVLRVTGVVAFQMFAVYSSLYFFKQFRR